MIELYKKAKSPDFWRSIRENEKYDSLIEELKANYLKERTSEIVSIPYSKRFLYYKNGDRATMENIYFQLRNWLSGAAALALLYPENEQYLTEAEDLIWACCDEYSWALPAHTAGTLEEDITYIDLFAAQTCMLISEICQVLEDRLNKTVLERAKNETRRRIINSFTQRSFPWENWQSNWSAVCTCGVTAGFMWLEPELYKKYIPKFLDSMHSFLASYPEDGTCLEGHGYWLYGFGHYAWFADMLYQFTNGQLDILNTEKNRNIAAYIQRNFLLGNTTVSFADGTRFGKAELGLQYYLHNRFPDTVELLPRSLCEISGSNICFYGILRSFIYYDAEKTVDTIPQRDYYLKNASQVILNRESYSFAIKGGSNGEPHNHNDIGSIIFSDKAGQILCDLGAGLYTGEYFGAGRYDIFCNSSLGHSVPIIGGKPQLCGSEYKGALSFENGCITVEMAAAYGNSRLRSLTRKILPDINGVTLCDTYDTDEVELVERFVTEIKPCISNGTVQIGTAAIKFNPSECTPSISSQIHYLHFNRVTNPNGGTQEIYCIDFKLHENTKLAKFEIVLE